jgi:hypothetical protein
MTAEAQEKLGVWHNGYDLIVAKGEADILEVLKEHYGYGDEKDMQDDGDFAGDGWEQLPDDRLLKINYEPGDEPPGVKLEQTCGEWAKENGRGFLCSIEY